MDNQIWRAAVNHQISEKYKLKKKKNKKGKKEPKWTRFRINKGYKPFNFHQLQLVISLSTLFTNYILKELKGNEDFIL